MKNLVTDNEISRSPKDICYGNPIDICLQELGQVDVCINNAGMSTAETLLQGKYENWKKMMDINVIGKGYKNKDESSKGVE